MRYQISSFELLKELLQRIPDDDSCMEWPRGKNKAGYGQLQTWNPDRERLVHRQAWIETFGPIPDGLYVCHRCDTPPCFRPSHLFLGDQRDNMRDCKSKGRNWTPPRHLSEPQIEQARELYRNGHKQRDIAVQLGVSQSVVYSAVADLPTVGQRNGINARFTPDEIREIRSLHATGMKQIDIAAKFSMKQGAVSNIILRKAWHWVD